MGQYGDFGANAEAIGRRSTCLVTPCFKVEKILKAGLSQRNALAEARGNRDAISLIMHLTGTRSCWGTARYALTAFFLGVAIIYLFGGFEPAVTLVN